MVLTESEEVVNMIVEKTELTAEELDLVTGGDAVGAVVGAIVGYVVDKILSSKPPPCTIGLMTSPAFCQITQK